LRTISPQRSILWHILIKTAHVKDVVKLAHGNAKHAVLRASGNIVLICGAMLLSGCATVKAAADSKITKSYHGTATWYQSGKKTADGKIFDPNKYSVAHRTLPFGTMLRLTNVKTGNTIDAVVNDRGPFVKGKELDVSRGGAQALGFFHSGTAKLLIEVLERRK